MIDYSTISNTSGSFPNVVGLNVTSPGAGDGTPWIKAFIDDLWGARQAVMDHANQTPNASTETASASQFLTAIQKICGNPGEVVAWMGDNSDPSSLDIRLLPLNGQGILRANYPDLDTYCYVGDSDNPTAPAFYRADDAAGTSRNTTGVYLIMPDLRGYTIRGLDTAAAVDPDGASRWIGDTQNYNMVRHFHNFATYTGSTPGNAPWHETAYWVYPSDPGGGAVNPTLLKPGSTGNAAFASSIIADKDLGPSIIYTGEESRMTNSAARWCIRY